MRTPETDLPGFAWLLYTATSWLRLVESAGAGALSRARKREGTISSCRSVARGWNPQWLEPVVYECGERTSEQEFLVS